MVNAIDHTGQTFGRLLVLRPAEESRYGGKKAFVCLCECGTEKIIVGTSLRRGLSRSCGCQTIQWGNQSRKTHGLARHRLVGTWRSMKQRCYNPNHDAYARYGGRGIKVCERWHALENFVADNEALAKPGLTLDRRDNDGDYTPDNCRWITPKEQGRNRSVNRLITVDGRTQCVAAWAEEYGVRPNLILERLERNWPEDEAVTTPPTPKQLLRKVGQERGGK